MKQFIITIASLIILIPLSTYSQFINNGSHISLTSGAALVFDSINFTNQTSTYDGDITSAGKIYVKGNWTNSATGGQLFDSTASAGEVIFTGYATHTISGRTTHFYKLSTLSYAKVDVSAANLIKVYNYFTNNGTFTLKSNTTRTAMLIDAGADSMLTGSGTYKFERYIPQGGWHYVSSPIVYTTNSSNFFWGGALYDYNETAHSWTKKQNNQQLDVMRGYDAYFKNGDKTIVFSGKYNTGEISISLTKNSDGYNFIGNPYPCTVDWDNSNGWTKTNIDNAIYIWDPALNSGQGDYMEYVNGVGNRGGTRYIPATQAFWVKCNSSYGGSLTIKNAAKGYATSPYFRSEERFELIRVFAAQDAFSNETTICFNRDASQSFDPKYDALKIFHSNVSVPQLYTISEDQKELAINATKDMGTFTIIPLYLKPGSDGKCKLAFDLSEIDNFRNVYLEDLFENKIFDLRMSNKIEITAIMSDNPHRFNIIFTDPMQISQYNHDNRSNLNEEQNNENLVYYSNGAIYLYCNELTGAESIVIYKAPAPTKLFTNKDEALIWLEQFKS